MDRVNLEVAIMSYIINYQPHDIIVNADDFETPIIRKIYDMWTAPVITVDTMEITAEEDDIIHACLDSDYASCGPYAYELDCRRLKEYGSYS